MMKSLMLMLITLVALGIMTLIANMAVAAVDHVKIRRREIYNNEQ